MDKLTINFYISQIDCYSFKTKHIFFVRTSVFSKTSILRLNIFLEPVWFLRFHYIYGTTTEMDFRNGQFIFFQRQYFLNKKPNGIDYHGQI